MCSSLKSCANIIKSLTIKVKYQNNPEKNKKRKSVDLCLMRTEWMWKIGTERCGCIQRRNKLCNVQWVEGASASREKQITESSSHQSHSAYSALPLCPTGPMCYWSYVNLEVKQANEEIRKLCRHFKKVTVIVLSNLSKRCHTNNCLHLNNNG